MPAFPTEFAELQREYPIFLRKDHDNGDWQAVALLGFDQHENLFLQRRPLECRLSSRALARAGRS